MRSPSRIGSTMEPKAPALKHEMTHIPAFLAFAIPGGAELLILVFVLVLLFGAKKLPELAKGIGRSMGEFKKARQEFDKEPEDDERAAAPPKDNGDLKR